MADDVASRLAAGESVIVDATLRSAAHRQSIIDAVQRVPWIIVHLVRTDAEVHRNLAARRGTGNYVSDADEEYYAHAKSTFEPPIEIDAEHLLRDTSHPFHPVRIPVRVVRLLGRGLDCLSLSHDR